MTAEPMEEEMLSIPVCFPLKASGMEGSFLQGPDQHHLGLSPGFLLISEGLRVSNCRGMKKPHVNLL